MQGLVNVGFGCQVEKFDPGPSEDGFPHSMTHRFLPMHGNHIPKRNGEKEMPGVCREPRLPFDVEIVKRLRRIGDVPRVGYRSGVVHEEHTFGRQGCQPKVRSSVDTPTYSVPASTTGACQDKSLFQGIRQEGLVIN